MNYLQRFQTLKVLGPHIKVRETSVALALIVPAPYTVHWI